MAVKTMMATDWKELFRRSKAHAVAECMVRAPKLGQDALIIVNLSGRGDKDVAQVAAKEKEKRGQS